jgi:hypothetical protein
MAEDWAALVAAKKQAKSAPTSALKEEPVDWADAVAKRKIIRSADTKTGAPFTTRAGLSFKADDEGKLNYLASKYGGRENVMQGSDGELYFKSPEGKWASVEEKGIGLGDIGDAVGGTVEALPSVVGGIATANPGVAALLSGAGTAVKQGIGAALPGEEAVSLGDRAKNIGLSAVLGGVGQKVANVAVKGINALRPHNVAAKLLQDEVKAGATTAKEAARAVSLAEKTGVALPRQLAEGSRKLLSKIAPDEPVANALKKAAQKNIDAYTTKWTPKTVADNMLFLEMKDPALAKATRRAAVENIFEKTLAKDSLPGEGIIDPRKLVEFAAKNGKRVKALYGTDRAGYAEFLRLAAVSKRFAQSAPKEANGAWEFFEKRAKAWGLKALAAGAAGSVGGTGVGTAVGAAFGARELFLHMRPKLLSRLITDTEATKNMIKLLDPGTTGEVAKRAAVALNAWRIAESNDNDLESEE